MLSTNMAGSLQSDATSAPPDNRTAEEKELAAMQERLNALPMLKVLSIMRKALPGDAHIDAEVDEVIKACIARFSGMLVKETKKQESLARHKMMQSEDIINALKHLGFKDSSTALSLFLSCFRVGTNRSQPQQEQLPVETTQPLLTELERQGNVGVPTGNTYRHNQGDIHGEANSSCQHQGNATVFPPPSQVIPAWHSSYEHPFSLQTLQGRTAWDAPFPQVVPNPYTAPWMNILPPSAPHQGPIQRYEQQVLMRMMQPQWNTERFSPNMHGFGIQQGGAAQVSDAPPFPHHISQPYPGYVQMQMMRQQQHVGDTIQGTGAGNTYAAPFSQEMAHMDLANVLQLVRQYEEQKDMP